jgi:hypothetical protein
MQCYGDVCSDGDWLQVEECNDFNSWFVLSDRANGVASFRAATTNLCMRLEDYDIRLRECDSNDMLQRFTGSFSSDKFEISPVLYSEYCLTQEHHPRRGEYVEIETCERARRDTTSYWIMY